MNQINYMRIALCFALIFLCVSCQKAEISVDDNEHSLVTKLNLPEEFLFQLKAEGKGLKKVKFEDEDGNPINVNAVCIDVSKKCLQNKSGKGLYGIC